MKSAGTIQKNAEKRASHDVLFSLCENAADKLILLVLLGSVLLFILWPIACIALRSLRGADGGVSFAMFGTVLRQYGESLRNSVFVGVFTAVLSTILSLSAALVCATARGWKKTLCMVVMLVAMVSPPFVSSLAYIQLYGRRGWITYRLLRLSLSPVLLRQGITVLAAEDTRGAAAYGVIVDIIRLEASTGGSIALEARWTLIDPGANCILGRVSFAGCEKISML